MAGVDGCRTGWAVAVGPAAGGGPVEAWVAPTLAEVLALDVAVVGVDMPIGLPPHGTRACDREARRRVGPRRSSVFPAPARGVLGAATWEAANERSRAIDGRGLARQTFGLLARIEEVDALLTPALQERVVEVHPEVSFARLAGRFLPFPKRAPQGRELRRRLVAEVFADVPVRLPGAAADDLLDACAVLWSAQRRARGEHDVLGDGEVDERGLRMEVVV